MNITHAKPVADWTDEEVVEYVSNFLTNQNGRAYNEFKDFCMYETPDGTKRCGVGCLIGDDYPQVDKVKGFNGDVHDLIVQFEDIQPYLGVDVEYDELGYREYSRRLALLASIQQVHDDKTNWVNGEFVAHHKLRWLVH